MPEQNASCTLAARRLLILGVIYLIPALRALQPVDDPDIWWHLRSGQWIVENAAVPQTDPFSSHGAGRTWLAYSWLFEVAVYGLYNWLGLLGIVLYRLVMALAIIAALHCLLRKWPVPFLLEGALLAVGAIGCLRHITERPWLVTILFWILTLAAVQDLRRGRRNRLVWMLPVCYALWANVHIQFVHGLLLLGLACIAPAIDSLRRKEQAGEEAARAGSRQWRQLAVLTGLCFLATLVNPYGFRLYGVVWDYASHTHAYDFVDELRAMSFRSALDWGVLGLTLAAAAALGRRPRVSSFEVLLLGAAVYFSFHSLRDIWLVTLAALTLLAAAGPASLQEGQRLLLTPRRIILVAAGVSVTVAVCFWGRGLTEQRLQAQVKKSYPVDAAAFIEKQGFEGPLYNHFNWGGYFIWALPRLPVAMDGRTNLHGDKRIRSFQNTWSGLPGWKEDPNLESARIVAASVKMPLVSLLRLDSRFEAVYEDEVAVVFVRRTTKAP